MQAEHQEKEAGSEDGTPAMEAAAPRSSTGEFVAHIYLLAVEFPREPLTVKRAIAESSLKGRCIGRVFCLLSPLARQAMLAQLDAADDPEAGSLKKVQANATKTFFPHVACRRERL